MRTCKDIIARDMAMSKKVKAWLREEGLADMLDNIQDQYERNCLLLEELQTFQVVFKLFEILDSGGQENIVNICLDGN